MIEIIGFLVQHKFFLPILSMKKYHTDASATIGESKGINEMTGNEIYEAAMKNNHPDVASMLASAIGRNRYCMNCD